MPLYPVCAPNRRINLFVCSRVMMRRKSDAANTVIFSKAHRMQRHAAFASSEDKDFLKATLTSYVRRIEQKSGFP